MKYFLVSLFILFCFRESIYGQQQAILNNEDLKVGLVLSGGGAKGFAHIGALKVIEEAGIRVDYIAGTSIGAIVGGLYASGYNASELDSIFKSVDFNDLIQDKVSRSKKTFYQKEADERYAITLPFDHFKLAVPSAISKGQGIYNMLVRLLDHIDTINFQELPIPFFCIATDVETGEEIVLNQGYLPEVISASGALPSLFRPVYLDGRLLTDGGVVNNYPIEELRKKGVDIIIGIDVQDELRDRENLKSAPEILIQVNNFRTIEAMKVKKKLTDIYIRPDIDDYTVVSFDEAIQIIEKGSLKAYEQLTALQDIASRQKKKNTLALSNQKRQAQDPLKIDNLSIRGNERYTDKFIQGKLKLKPPQLTDYKSLEEGINNLATSDNFGRIGYQIIKKNNNRDLNVWLKESENTQNIRLGLHYDDLYRSGALLNFTKKRTLFKDDLTSFDLVLGENIRYRFDYYIDKGFWSVGVRSAFNTFDQGINRDIAQAISTFDFAAVNSVGLNYRDLTNELYIKTLFIKTFSLDIGLQHKYLSIDTETVLSPDEEDANFTFERSHFYGAKGQLVFDNLDKRFFPTSGVYFKGDFDLYLFADDFNSNFTEFSIAKASLKYAKQLSPHLSILTEAAGGFKVGGSDIQTLDFFLGGYGNNYVNSIIPFLGYDYLSLTGDGYVKFALDLDYTFYKKHHFTLTANYANIEDGLFSSGEWFSSPDFSGYALGYAFETFLGPLQVKYSLSPEVLQSEWFISLGFWF